MAESLTAGWLMVYMSNISQLIKIRKLKETAMTTSTYLWILRNIPRGKVRKIRLKDREKLKELQAKSGPG